MSRFIGTLLSVAMATQTSFAQHGRIVHRVGDAFLGPIKQVRTETAQLKIDGDTVLEGPRFLIQIVTYSRDGLTKEVAVYFPNGAVRQKSVEKFLPSGNRERNLSQSLPRTMSLNTFEGWRSTRWPVRK
jgi:hypothetical protein